MDFRRLLPEIRWQSCLSPVPGIGFRDGSFDPVHSLLIPAELSDAHGTVRKDRANFQLAAHGFDELSSTVS